jgi:integrase
LASKKLTAKKVAAITKPGRYGDGDGLYLAVDDAARTGLSRRWFVFVRVAGRRREMAIGKWPEVSLADARDVASAARHSAKAGIDPVVARQTERKAASVAASCTVRCMTLRDVAESYHKSHSPTWRSQKTKDAWLRPFELHAPDLLARPIGEIDTQAVVDVLQKIWTEKAETARRIRGRLERILDSARVLGLTEPEKANPARLSGNLEYLLPRSPRLQRGHHRALPWQEMPSFMAALRMQQGIGAIILEFIILTAARSGEARHAVWADFDLDSATWIIPGSKMKSGKRHRVPLSTRAVEIIREMHQGSISHFAFPGSRQEAALSDMGAAMTLRRMGRTDISVHGMRSTFRDWAGEASSFPRELAELALSHAVGDQVERAYARGDALDRRRPLMQAWCQYCVDQSGADVIRLGRRRVKKVEV